MVQSGRGSNPTTHFLILTRHLSLNMRIYDKRCTRIEEFIKPIKIQRLTYLDKNGKLNK